MRNLWKSLDEFRSGLSSDREVVESILHRTVEKYRLDATDLSIKLPDLLIRECEHEIQRVSCFRIFHQQYTMVL